MMAEVHFILEAIEDIVDLDGSVQPRVLRKIMLLEENPDAGQPLGNRAGSQLATFRKLVVGNRDWRIVYRVEPSGDIVVIWVVADREDDVVYREASRRLQEVAGKSPETVGFEGFVDRLKKRGRDVVD